MNTDEANNIIDPEWEVRLMDFAFGALAPHEAELFERQLEESRAKSKMAEEYTGTISMLGNSVAPIEPPEGHKARFLAKLEATPHASAQQATTTARVQPDGIPATHLKPVEREGGRDRSSVLASSQEERIIDIMEARARRQRSPLVPALAAAAAVLIMLMGAWLWSLSSSLADQESRRVAAEQNLAVEQRLRETAEQRLDEFAQNLNIPAGYRILEIAAQGTFSSTGIVLYNPETEDASLLAAGLEQPAEGKVYEFWLLPAEQGVTPQAAGVFTPEATGTVKHTNIAPGKIGGYAGFAVTLEDAPGGPTPAGPLVMAGTFR